MKANQVFQLWKRESKKKHPKHVVIPVFLSRVTKQHIQLNTQDQMIFFWKSSLCKLTFAMIITYIMLTSYVKPPWCPYESPSHLGNVGMGQHRSAVISFCFILQYSQDFLYFQWQIHAAWLADAGIWYSMITLASKWDSNAHLCYSPFNVAQSWTQLRKKSLKSITYLWSCTNGYLSC